MLIVISLGTIIGLVCFVYGFLMVGGFVRSFFVAFKGRGPLGQVASEHHRLSEVLKPITDPAEARQINESSTLPPWNKKMVLTTWERSRNKR